MFRQFNKKISLKLIYIITVLIYIIIDTRYKIPYDMVLRWILPGILLLLVITQCRKIQIFPNYLYFFIIAYFGVTIFQSSDRFYSFQRWVSLILIVSTYLTYYTYLANHDELDNVVSILGLLYIAYGIVNFFFLGTTVSGRAVGVTSSANSLGIEANISLAFASYFHEKSERRYKLFWIALMIAFGIEVIMSGSRMAIGALFIFLAYLILFKLKNRFLIILPIILVLVFFFLPNDVWMKIPGFNRVFAFGITRDHIWEYAINVYRQKPWFGYGYGSVNTTIVYAMAEGLGYHSSYLTVLIETGWVGLSFMIMLLVKAFYDGCFVLKKTRSDELRLMLLLFVVMLVSFYSESSMTSTGSIEGFIFWGILVWIIVKCKQEKSKLNLIKG